MPRLAATTLAATLLVTNALADNDKKSAAGGPQKLVTINGQPVTNYQVLAFNALQHGEPATTRKAQVRLLNQLINTLLIAQQAEKTGLDKDENVKAAVDMARVQVLAEAQITRYLDQNKVTEDELQKAYKKKYSGENLNEYKVRHILVQKQKEAEEIIRLLNKDKKRFAELAKAKSLDMSKENGGSLGWLRRDEVVKPFGEAMVKLKKGEYTQAPVKSSFGWHVIMVDDVRQEKAPPLQEVKAELVAQLQQQKLSEYVGRLRKEAKIEVAGRKPAAGSK